MAMTLHFDKVSGNYDHKAEEELLQKLRDIIENDDAKYVPCKKRFKEFQDAFISTCKLFSGNKVGIKKGQLSLDGWFIIIKTNELEFKNTPKLVKEVLRVADNFEIAADLSGNLEFSIGFYGMVEEDV